MTSVTTKEISVDSSFCLIRDIGPVYRARPPRSSPLSGGRQRPSSGLVPDPSCASAQEGGGLARTRSSEPLSPQRRLRAVLIGGSESDPRRLAACGCQMVWWLATGQAVINGLVRLSTYEQSYQRESSPSVTRRLRRGTDLADRGDRRGSSILQTFG